MDVTGRCTEPGCVWPEHTDGRCVIHLRQEANPEAFMTLEVASLYSDIGNVSHAGYGRRHFNMEDGQ